MDALRLLAYKYLITIFGWFAHQIFKNDLTLLFCTLVMGEPWLPAVGRADVLSFTAILGIPCGIASKGVGRNTGSDDPKRFSKVAQGNGAHLATRK
jgi:hypothetical protein